jgi:esterase/lipase superfamily enzyme
MELLIFGHEGPPVLFFPTRMARFYDYEDWGVINALKEKIVSGQIQLFCIDSFDKESFYCKTILPLERIKKYLQFEKYLLDELIPFISQENENPHLISAGCSLGAYHAVNIAFRHPLLFKKVIGISGRYDLTIHLQFYNDLFDGYRNEDIYFNMPSQYIPNLTDEAFIHSLQNLEIIFIVGNEDAFLENNILLSDHLKKKNIPNILHLMEGEAHKPKYWGELLKLYL